MPKGYPNTGTGDHNRRPGKCKPEARKRAKTPSPTVMTPAAKRMPGRNGGWLKRGDNGHPGPGRPSNALRERDRYLHDLATGKLLDRLTAVPCLLTVDELVRIHATSGRYGLLAQREQTGLAGKTIDVAVHRRQLLREIARAGAEDEADSEGLPLVANAADDGELELLRYQQLG